MQMSLDNTRRVFERLGGDDPLWAVLTSRDKKGGKWDPGEFFATGQREIESVMAYLKAKGFGVPRQAALDFGCGVGRLTQALAEHFEVVTGVDIAESMVAAADRFNKFPDRCRFVVNTAPNLACLPDASFDFVYSNITLQHMPPDNAREFIREFIRLLRLEGIALFQMPSDRVFKHPEGSMAQRWEAWRFEQFRPWWKRVRGKPLIPMHGIPREQVEQFLTDAGASLLDVVEDDAAGEGWVSCRYSIRKQAPATSQ